MRVTGTKSRTGLYGRSARMCGFQRDCADGGEKQRVAVGLGLRDVVGADCRVRAGLVFDQHTLPKDALELVGKKPCDEIGRSAGRERDDKANRACRKILCDRACCRAQQCQAASQNPQIPKQPHAAPPSAGPSGGFPRLVRASVIGQGARRGWGISAGNTGCGSEDGRTSFSGLLTGISGPLAGR